MFSRVAIKALSDDSPSSLSPISNSICTQPSSWSTTEYLSSLDIWVHILDSVEGSERTFNLSVLTMAMSVAVSRAKSLASCPTATYWGSAVI